MRILIFNWRDRKHPLAGGAEVYTDAVATEWVKMGHSVTLFCGSVESEPERELLRSGYTVIRRGSKHTVYSEARRFWKHEGSGNFDLVIDEVNTRPFFCASFVSDAIVAVIMHQVAREVWFYESPIPIAMIGRFILEPWWLWRLRNQNIITVSESSRRSIIEYGAKKVTVVPEGYWPTTATVTDRESSPTLVFLGRLSANKRPIHAIKAFEIIRGQIPKAQLWIIGDGPLRKKLEAKATEGVEFLGRLSESEKVKRLASAHLLVATSVREGWGMVVSEAARNGTPTIGYDVAGLVDSVLSHGGTVVSQDPRALASAVIRFLSGQLALTSIDGISTGKILTWDAVALSILRIAESGVSN